MPKYVDKFNMYDGTQVLIKDSALATEVNNVKGRTTALETSQATQDGQITALQNSVAMQALANRKFIFIGDSYDAGWTPEGTFTGWGERAAGVLKKTRNVSYWNQYYGGAGFGFANDNQMSFYYQLKTVGDAMSSSVKNSITDIVFGGGRNDHDKANNTINSGIRACADYINTNFHNARVWLFAIGWDGVAVVRRQLQAIYYEAYSRAVDYGNWRYRELYQFLHNKAYMGSDQKHPNSDGNYLLGNQIGNILCGSESPIGTSRLAFNLNNVSSSGNAIRNGNYVTCNCQHMSIDYTQGSYVKPEHTVVTDTGIPVDCVYIFGASVTTLFSFPLNIIITCNNNTFYNCVASAKFVKHDDNTLTLALATHCINAQNGAYILTNDITNIQIPAQSFTLPITEC